MRSFQLNLQGCSLPFAHAKGALRSFRYPVFKEQRAACFSGTSYLTTSAGFASTALRGSNCQQMGVGGAKRDRTADPLLARQVLSQLSYGPIFLSRQGPRPAYWALVDSNHRPHPYQGCALTN